MNIRDIKQVQETSQYKALDKPCRTILSCILDTVNHRKLYFGGRKYLQDKTGYSKRSITRHVPHLIQAGYLIMLNPAIGIKPPLYAIRTNLLGVSECHPEKRKFNIIGVSECHPEGTVNMPRKDTDYEEIFWQELGSKKDVYIENGPLEIDNLGVSGSPSEGCQTDYPGVTEWPPHSIYNSNYKNTSKPDITYQTVTKETSCESKCIQCNEIIKHPTPEYLGHCMKCYRNTIRFTSPSSVL